MRSRCTAGRGWFRLAALTALGALGLAAAMPNLFQFADSTGTMATYDTAGAIQTTNPFFQSLGTNGRSCATCHVPQNALGLSNANALARFTVSRGTDPLFVDVDGANCPGAAASDRAAHSLIVGNGLLRVALPIPQNADYTVQTVYDPYGCAEMTDAAGQRMLSVYRRPLPAANLRFLSAVMFDGRETVAPLDNPSTFEANLVTDLTHQALDATLGHAQAAHPPTDQQLAGIIDFELSLYSAQSTDDAAGSLQAQRAAGGPVALSGQLYYPGINDSLGADPGGGPFTNKSFTIFEGWTDLSNSRQNSSTLPREQIAAGEAIFNSAPLTITGVAGLNDAQRHTSIAATCSACHDAPNAGSHSLPLPLDIGVSHSSTFESDPVIASALQQLSVPDLPVFKVTCTGAQPARVVFTSDPGRALITGRCADVNRFKGPVLRGLAARAPYFHNGAAATLGEVVDFYNERFDMRLTDEQKEQLVAFLQSL